MRACGFRAALHVSVSVERVYLPVSLSSLGAASHTLSVIL